MKLNSCWTVLMTTRWKMEFGQLETISVYIYSPLFPLLCCLFLFCFSGGGGEAGQHWLYLKYLYLCIITLQWSEEAQSIAGSGSAAGEHRSVRYDFKSFGDAARSRLRGSGCCAIVSKSSDDIY